MARIMKSDVWTIVAIVGAVLAFPSIFLEVLGLSKAFILVIFVGVGLPMYIVGTLCMSSMQRKEMEFKRCLQYPAPGLFQREYREQLRQKVDRRMDEEFAGIVSASTEIKNLLVGSPEKVLEIERLRENLEEKRAAYDEKKRMFCSFGFRVRSERKRTKALHRKQAV